MGCVCSFWCNKRIEEQEHVLERTLDELTDDSIDEFEDEIAVENKTLTIVVDRIIE